MIAVMDPKNLASLPDSKDTVLGEASRVFVPKVLSTMLVLDWQTEATSAV